jgi:N-acetylglucosaminyldiphosphoundecaprenol N-acetyl-beta-D-mannosaminyltransferase
LVSAEALYHELHHVTLAVVGWRGVGEDEQLHSGIQVAGLITRQRLNIIHPLSQPPEKQVKSARANVLGVGVSALNLDRAVAVVARALEEKARGYICVTGVHGVSEAQKDPSFRAILNHSFLTTPDGMPTVWMGRWQGFHDMGRVYGPDLMLRVCELTQSRPFTHYLYGGGPGVAEELKQRLEKRFPGIKIAGTYTPPFRPLSADEEQDLTRRVAALKPDLFWVGLSTPKQEKFMAEHWNKLDANLFFGVGAAFDFHAGRIPQAPLWMQRSGLEWVFRLGCDPGRLWKRYLKNNPLFIARAFCQVTRLRKYSLD